VSSCARVTVKTLAAFQIVYKINGSVHIFHGTALNLLKKCGGLPTAATMKGSFSEA
jgi:hypothetical protein